MSDLRDAVLKAAASIPHTPFSQSADRMNGFGDGHECESVRLRPLLSALADCTAELEQLTECVCDEAYKSRGLTDPQCNHRSAEPLARLREVIG